MKFIIKYHNPCLITIERKVPIAFCIGIDETINLKQAELVLGKVSKGANYSSHSHLLQWADVQTEFASRSKSKVTVLGYSLRVNNSAVITSQFSDNINRTIQII